MALTAATATRLEQDVVGLGAAPIDAPWSRPGPLQTPEHRQARSMLYHVVAGAGVSEIDGGHYDWRRCDFPAVPPRPRHPDANSGAEPTVLFSSQDVPLLKALGHDREEA